MNKTAIKNYAIWARKELIERVTRKAYEYGIEKNKQGNKNEETINEKLLSKQEIKQRKELIQKINENGFDQVMEEVAYTWFNRFIAFRFMEVNNYLPNRIRLFTNEFNEFKPQILEEALNVDLEGLDPQRIYDLLQANDRQELYKELLIASCDDMGNYLPGMFTKINDYKVLLFPDNLLNNESVIGRMISDIDVNDFNVQKEGQVEIIGWLYQYYNTEPKAEVYAKPKGYKVSKGEIPFVTQMFTPDWIVRYMIQNSVGRLYIDKKKHMGIFADGLSPNEMSLNDTNKKRIENERFISSQFDWKYYLPEAKQEKEVIDKLEKIEQELMDVNPEELTVMDPCMGSGHILVYAFEVLMQIYKDCGYSERDAALSIIQNNLYGMDIDERAYQLTYFALMMKARQYNRRILRMNIDGKKIEPNIIYIRNSYPLEKYELNLLSDSKDIATRLIQDFEDAEELGSIIKVNYSLEELLELENKIEQLQNADGTGNLLDMIDTETIADTLLPLIKQAKYLSQKYWICVTNPPYLSVRGGMNTKLNKYVTKNYVFSKNDMFTVFMDVCYAMLKDDGIYSIVNQHSWMFLSGFKKFRETLYDRNVILNLLHIGAGAFEGIGGEVVQSVACVFRKYRLASYNSTFLDLTHFKWKKYIQNSKYIDNIYFISIKELNKIPNKILCYQLGGNAIKKYNTCKRLDQFADPRVGMATGENEKFVRLWQEVEFNKVGIGYLRGTDTIGKPVKWFPYNKGGEYRRWYGNRTHLVDWENDGYNIRTFKEERLQKGEIEKKNSECWNREYYFLESISWSKVSSNRFSVRYYEPGFIFDVAGCSIFGLCDNLFYIMGALNSELKYLFIELLSPTLNFETGAIKSFPIIIAKSKERIINDIVKKCINFEKIDWDSFETSWDFEEHPLVKNREIVFTIQDSYSLWKKECNNRFSSLKANEEELNKVFINIYGLKDELTPEVEDKDITVHCLYDTKDVVPENMKNNNYALTKRDVVVSFISYAVGCMFGRYSLDVPGLAFAGGMWDTGKYTSYIPDADNIIPISSDEYFEDDIVDRFVQFVEAVYGKDTLEENLNFIASVLGGKGTSRKVIRDYFLKDFYKDHCKIYQKRPIYWLFDSGKKNGFKALMYIHRYQPDLIARLRTQYVFEQQSCYRNLIEMDEKLLDGELTSSERVRLNKELKALKGQDEELRKYEEEVHHYADMMLPMDLDDGVKVNYEKFGKLLAKIK